jgi:hypothetical protein
MALGLAYVLAERCGAIESDNLHQRFPGFYVFVPKVARGM